VAISAFSSSVSCLLLYLLGEFEPALSEPKSDSELKERMDWNCGRAKAAFGKTAKCGATEEVAKTGAKWVLVANVGTVTAKARVATGAARATCLTTARVLDLEINPAER